MNTASPLFNLKRLALHFARAQTLAKQEGPHPLLQELDDELAERISEINRPFLTILEIGKTQNCLGATLQAHNPARSFTKIYYLHAPDAAAQKLAGENLLESLSAQKQAFDLVILNQVLQHINDVPGFLIQTRQLLKPDGLLLAACLGGETLRELRAVLSQVESDSKGGVSPRIAPMLDVRAGGQLLQRAGFALPACDHSLHTLIYKNAHALMRDVRHMGETQSLNSFNRHYVGRDFFEKVSAQYKKSYANETGEISATFDTLFLAGWAPAANQQTPLKPGSATQALETALNNSKSKN